ncbi:MDR family MFS transporter [Cohnella thermotolerans]|uniref:MDR family MFS transporter n=1 Tax=Cohnella thermotolerans TaxID=329858 RepID=UPI000426F7A5|nr:MDR family MFS transporter [Cohnella thermotolerans]
MAKQTNLKWVVVGLLVALFIGALDVTVVSTAVPNMIGDLQGGHLISWVFTTYTLTTCVTTPIFGKLTDLFGRKAVFAIGVAMFVIGSALCGMAQSMTALIWFRALQGIGAGALNPVCFTIVGDLFTGEKRGKMMGVFASVWSVAGLLGPLVGGYFVDQVSWRWIFFINLPLGIVAFVLVMGFLKEKFDRQAKKIDYWGAVTFTVAVSALMYALLSGGEKYAWDSPVILGLFAAAALFLVLFLRIESQAKEPMMPLSLFRNRVMNISNLSGFLAFSITSGVTIYAPIWIQSVLGHSATSSGLTVMPMSIFWPIASNLAGRLMYKLGVKASVVAGAVIVTAGAAWLTALELQSPYWYWVFILSMIGFGMGLVSTPTTVMVQSAVGWEQRGVATAANSLLRSLGQTVGVAVFGTIYNYYVADQNVPAQLVRGMHVIFLLMIAIAAAHLLAVLFLPSHRKVMAQQAS